MNDVIYLRAEWNEIIFAIPSSILIRIVSDPLLIALPDPPTGVCGIIYEEGEMHAIRSLSAKACTLPKLVILCASDSGCTAYAADRVETVGELTRDEWEGAVTAGEPGILLLDGKEKHGQTQ
jgi:hypothetical protein